jgi:hypothetical protein
MARSSTLQKQLPAARPLHRHKQGDEMLPFTPLDQSHHNCRSHSQMNSYLFAVFNSFDLVISNGELLPITYEPRFRSRRYLEGSGIPGGERWYTSAHIHYFIPAHSEGAFRQQEQQQNGYGPTHACLLEKTLLRQRTESTQANCIRVVTLSQLSQSPCDLPLG